jgi:hypothetical protein
MAPEPYEPPRTVSLEVNVRLPDLARCEPEHGSAVYAFARSGQLLEKVALPADGRARLQLPDLRVMQEVRVMVGPRTLSEHSTLPELSRRGAMEQFVRISPGIEPPILHFDVEGARLRHWLRRSLVRGTLHKHEVNRAAHAHRALADTHVQIWEIEPIELMIAKLPDKVIEDFRDLIIEANIADIANTVNASTASIRRSALRAARLQSKTPLIAAQMWELQRTPHFAALVERAHETTSALRDYLVQAAAAVRLLLCLLYPAWIRKHMLANALTDASGRFEALVFPSSHCPSLNLYFTASATYRGTSVPVYDPRPVACFTYWDYQTGTEISLVATADPIAMELASPAHDAYTAPRVIAADGA